MMGSGPEIYKVFSGDFCSYLEEKKSRALGGHSEKVYEKRPHVARFCELHKVLFF